MLFASIFSVLSTLAATVLLLIILFLLGCLIKTLFVRNKEIRILNRDITDVEEHQRCQESFYSLLSVYQKSNNSYIESLRSLEPINTAKSNDFIKGLIASYPNIHSKFSYKQVEKGYIYEYKTKSPRSMLYVVEVENFQKEPNARLSQKHVHGKGTFNNKATIFCLFEAVEQMLKADELKINVTIVLKLKSNAPLQILMENNKNKKYGLVLTDGAGILSPVSSGLRSYYAFIGVANPGVVRIRFETAKVSMGKNRLESFKYEFINSTNFKARYDSRMAKTMTAVGKDMEFFGRFMFTNNRVFSPFLGKIIDGTVITTSYNTVVEGLGKTFKTRFKCHEISEGETKYYVDIDFFLAFHEKKEDVLLIVNKIAKKYNVSASISFDDVPHFTSTKSVEYRCVVNAINQTMKNVYVTPYVTTNEFSNHGELDQLSDNVIRFSPIFYSQNSLMSRSSDSEYVSTTSLIKAIQFYQVLIKKYSEE